MTTSNEQETSTELRELSIDDDMVRLLKSGEINNRLFCELSAHPGFKKFLADLEIYVDGLAGLQIQSLNAIVDGIRDTIMNESGDAPATPQDARNLLMLKTAHIEDDAYFFNLLHSDLDAIAKDLREAHKDDPDAAPDDMIASQFKETLNKSVFP